MDQIIDTKEEKINIERNCLINRLAASNLLNVRDKVAYILNHYPEARNSDIFLSYKYWELFQSELYGLGDIDVNTAMRLEKQSTIIRARAKIQNEYGLFQAKESVRKKRKELDTEEREVQVLDKPEEAALLFYLDESSKNEKYVLVGGLCFFDGRRMFEIVRNLASWKATNNISFEFHFSKLTKHKLEAYKSFFLEALSMSDLFGLHAIAVKNDNVSDINIAIYKMHYQLVIQGAKHEIESKRITLPREVLVYKDEDGPMDKLMLTKLEQDYETGFRDYYEGNLNLQLLASVNSEQNPLMQITDLFIGSIARKLNHSGESYNQKDELSNYILEALNLSKEDQNSYTHDNVFFRVL